MTMAEEADQAVEDHVAEAVATNADNYVK